MRNQYGPGIGRAAVIAVTRSVPLGLVERARPGSLVRSPHLGALHGDVPLASVVHQ
jgi:hypothetical protein